MSLRRDAAIVTSLGLVARLGVVAWAAPRFPPTADGTYYARLAERIGAGLGSTWLWPDGAVTYAAHYPIGYPGAVGLLYALFGPHPALAMLLNALVGALAVLAVHQLVARAGGARAAWIAGLVVALHPGLVMYTPALMTEGVVAALLACAAWAAASARGPRPWVSIAALGAVLGAATLVRPQSIVLAPAFGLVAGLACGPGGTARRLVDRARRPLAFAIASTVIALAVCAPWTLRNCERMGRCALVSVNGGWNLLIGADAASTGAWSPVQVPEACREVWDEAEKDACFSRAGLRYIAEHPGAWLSLVPSKLAATFDYTGAAGYYLHASNAAAFGDDAKVALGAIETVYERALLLLALAWSMQRRATDEARSWPRAAFAVAGMIAAFTLHAWLGYAALLIAGAARLRGEPGAPVLPFAALAVLASTMLTHAVFFGAGRYGLVTFPLLAGLSALGAAALRPSGVPWRSPVARAGSRRRSPAASRSRARAA